VAVALDPAELERDALEPPNELILEFAGVALIEPEFDRRC
jgi:hypothetical protein